MKNNQNIKCDVYDCIHCIIDKEHCNLKEIKVSKRNTNEHSICSSFDKRK